MSGAIKPVYFIFGGEDLLLDEELKRVRDDALGENSAMGSLNYQEFDFSVKALEAKDEFTPKDIINAAMTMPAFAPMRFIAVKGAETMKTAELNELLPYIKDPSPTTSLVFIARGWKISKSTSFYKYLKEKKLVKQFYSLKHGELLRWILDYARREGKKISREAAERLTAVAGDKLADIKGELDKVILYVGEREEVKLADVDICVMDVKEETAFDLANALGRRDLAAAFSALAKLSAEEPVKILGAVVWQFRTLVKVKALLNKGVPQAKLLSLVKVAPKKLQSYLAICKNFRAKELNSVLFSLRRANMALRSGGLPKGLVMARLVMELCSRQGSASAGNLELRY
jgi:DNA polymerase-3 subunit delta